jgi:hypothetical protein
MYEIVLVNQWSDDALINLRYDIYKTQDAIKIWLEKVKNT